jgi:hypothetical protein
MTGIPTTKILAPKKYLLTSREQLICLKDQRSKIMMRIWSLLAQPFGRNIQQPKQQTQRTIILWNLMIPPKTINKSIPTAATENMSIISDTIGSNQEILQQMENMSLMIAKLTQLIPDAPGNQSILAEIRSGLPTLQSAGCSSKSLAPSSSSGAGALPR